ncbi:MAG: acyl-CoA thioesterase [Phormidesmis sp. RL_2_1]|nr:acyl-CoA thioesterase [Phormidesmis sp. RL_2_1]
MTDVSIAPASSPTWFEYPIRVQPHHTDYSGVVWHGSYITWLESARVECLRAAGIPFEHLVNSGYDLPVVRLDLRYRQPLMLGDSAIVKTRLAPMAGLRLNWLYEIEMTAAHLASAQLCLAGQITLVTVSVSSRKVLRRLPTEVKEMVEQITTYLTPSV